MNHPLKQACRLRLLGAAMLALGSLSVQAQSEIYPEHFNLSEVRLTGGAFRQALEINNKLLLEYDVDRLLTPFIRQAGLTTQTSSKYYGWDKTHPSFSNWGLSSWSLEGHVGGHYLTALALAYAATDDAQVKAQMKARLDYMLDVLNDCQRAFDSNTEGMKGFLGGQPINQIWTGLYKQDLAPFKQYGGWVPFYCEHKTLAGLRDAWLYTGSSLAKTLYRDMCDWAILVVSNLTDAQMQDILGWEHGGMNEPLADAYKIFGDVKYLNAARRYSHATMVDNMQTLNTTFLDGKHANTQVPKYIGFERIYQEAANAGTQSADRKFQLAAHNFWTDVVENRTVCIGGNSVSEHFQSKNNGQSYINNLEGPESCNTNNMLKLSEMLFDETHDARYADFYENAMWNHILSTQDPKTGGYVYFTSLRPQSYRIYSTVNEGMWCCVGTGMENHSKYAHFAYTHSADGKTLYVNLFTPSVLSSGTFSLTQETDFPATPSTKLTIGTAGTYTLAIRHPHWTTSGFSVSVNGTKADVAATPGTASYVSIRRTWKKGDVVEVNLPMELRVEECPNYTDYIAFKYGPLLLAAQTTAESPADESATGLSYEALQNEYGHEGRMDHSPGAMGKALSLSSAPLLIGHRSEVLQRITPTDEPLTFLIDASSTQSKGGWTTLKLVPFYTIQHARYTCYWYQQTEEAYKQSDMGLADAREAAVTARTLDYVATGEQQSEAGHDALYQNSTSGSYNGEFYRDARVGGFVQYVLSNPSGRTDSISLFCRFTTADRGRTATITIDGVKLVDITIPSSVKNAESNGFFNVEYLIPAALLTDSQGKAKERITFRIAPNGTTPIPGLYFLRLMSGYEDGSYKFVATDWRTGDSNRVAQNNISYDTDGNTITVKASGANNVCLSFNTDAADYTVPLANKYLVVKGQGLASGSTQSYLWWLNGINRGSQVSPTTVTTAGDGERVIAWDITQSQLDANSATDPWTLSTGATIFGLTASSGTARISYIGFVPSVASFLEAVGIENLTEDPQARIDIYDLQGRLLRANTTLQKAAPSLPHGIYVAGKRKVII